MTNVTLSKNFQIFIPEEIRKTVPLEAGQQIRITAQDGVITLVPITTTGQLPSHPVRLLFSAWHAEDATDDPQEIEERFDALESFKQAMNTNRSSERPLYKPSSSVRRSPAQIFEETGFIGCGQASTDLAERSEEEILGRKQSPNGAPMLLNHPKEPIPLETDTDGIIRVGGTSVTLETLIAVFESGATPEEIVRDFPVLGLADVYAVITYYLRHRGTVDDYLKTRHRNAQEVRRKWAERYDQTRLRECLKARLENA